MNTTYLIILNKMIGLITFYQSNHHSKRCVVFAVAGSELDGGSVMEMGIKRLPEGCDACPYGLCNPFDEQELVVRRWCYVPFETNDVGALCWESVDHPLESVNHRVRCIRCFCR